VELCAPILLQRGLRYALVRGEDRRTGSFMKKILASFFTIILVVGITLGAIFVLVRATLYVTAIASPLARAGAIVAELFLGVILLLGTVWVATHLAVRIFSTANAGGPQALNGSERQEPEEQGGPLV
jgi:hypothetical protein